MIIRAEIEVERGDDRVLVALEGSFEHYGSYDRNQRGLGLADWDAWVAGTGDPIILDNSEKDMAVERLYRAVERP